MKLILMVASIILLSNPFVFKRYQIFGNASEGCYTLPIYLGGESQFLQKQSMLIDTGSPQTTITGSECTLCQKRQLPFYNPKDSSSSHIVKCGEKLQICKTSCQKDKDYCYNNIHFLDGSQSYGKIIEDKVRFSSEESDDEAYIINFLCNQIEYFSSVFKPNGIIGFAPNNVSNILNWWFYRNQKEAVFTICMAKDGGFLQLGKNQQIQQHDLILEFDNNTQSYEVIGLESLSFGTVQLLSAKKDQLKFLIDTGSSKSIFPESVIELIINQLKDTCQSTGSCIYLTGVNCVKSRTYKQQLTLRALDDLFPDIQFKISSDTFKMMPSQYFIRSQEDSSLNSFCLTLLSISQYDKIILGIDFMAENRFEFNLDKSTISVKHQETCSYEPLKQYKTIEQFNYEDYYVQIISIIILAITFFLSIKPNIRKILKFFRSLTKSKPKAQLQQQSTVDHQNYEQSKQAESNKENVIEKSEENVANSMVNSEIDSVLKDETV